jgi:hypothetical protein
MASRPAPLGGGISDGAVWERARSVPGRHDGICERARPINGRLKYNAEPEAALCPHCTVGVGVAPLVLRGSPPPPPPKQVGPWTQSAKHLSPLRLQMTQMTATDPASTAAGGGPTAQLLKMGGPVQQARNFAVMTGVNAGMSALMKRVRGKEDLQGS